MTEREPLSDLIARVDLVALVTQFAGTGRPSSTGVTFRCPHPSHEDRHPSFSVSRARTGREYWRCFSQCDRHGDALDLVRWLDEVDIPEAVRRLRSFLGDAPAIERPTPRPSKTPRRRPVIPDPASTGRVPDDPQAARNLLERYLAHRRWTPDTAHRFDLSVVVDAQHRMRIRHPFYAPDGDGVCTVAYWQDRGTRGVTPRWLSPAGVAPVLYNLPSISPATDVVVVCEGAPDTITATLALDGQPGISCIGVPGASSWRDDWGSVLEGRRVVVVPDPDDAGRRLVETISRSCPEPFTVLPLLRCDLTDTARAVGIDKVRTHLLRACDESRPLTDDETLALLREAFPDGFLTDDPSETSER